MSGNGPLPKPNGSRQRRNGNNRRNAAVLPHENRDAEVPPLPQSRAWCDEAIAWWFSVWESPMATQYEKSDLPALLQLCVFVDEFHTTTESAVRLKLAAEIRLRGEQFGLSPAARARLGWKIAPAPERNNSQRPPAGDDGEDPRSVLGRQGNVVPIRSGAA